MLPTNSVNAEQVPRPAAQYHLIRFSLWQAMRQPMLRSFAWYDDHKSLANSDVSPGVRHRTGRLDRNRTHQFDPAPRSKWSVKSLPF